MKPSSSISFQALLSSRHVMSTGPGCRYSMCSVRITCVTGADIGRPCWGLSRFLMQDVYLHVTSLTILKLSGPGSCCKDLQRWEQDVFPHLPQSCDPN